MNEDKIVNFFEPLPDLPDCGCATFDLQNKNLKVEFSSDSFSDDGNFVLRFRSTEKYPGRDVVVFRAIVKKEDLIKAILHEEKNNSKGLKFMADVREVMEVNSSNFNSR